MTENETDEDLSDMDGYHPLTRRIILLALTALVLTGSVYLFVVWRFLLG